MNIGYDRYPHIVLLLLVMVAHYAQIVRNAEVIQKRTWRKPFADLPEADFWLASTGVRPRP
jgi:hypothetical protein